MRLRIERDAECETLCQIIAVISLSSEGGSLLPKLAAGLEADPCPRSFGAGRIVSRRAGTLKETRARADSHICMLHLGSKLVSKFAAERHLREIWMPHQFFSKFLWFDQVS